MAPKLLLFRGIFCPGRAEQVMHSVVAFVAGILEDLVAVLVRNRESDSPGRGISLRVGNRHFVLDVFRIDARESLHQLQIVAVRRGAVSVHTDAVTSADEIGGFDNQCVAFPMTARIAHIGAQVGRGVWAGVTGAIQWDEPRFMDHFVANGNHARRLNDLRAVSINYRKGRAGDAARDAAVVHAAVEPGFGAAVADLVYGRAERLRFFCQRRNAAVGRIDHQRSLTGCVPAEFLKVRRSGGGVHALLTGPIAGVRADPLSYDLRLRLIDLPGAFGELLIGKVSPVAELGGTLERDITLVVARPCAL